MKTMLKYLLFIIFIVLINLHSMFSQTVINDTTSTYKPVSNNNIYKNDELKLSKEDMSLMYKAFDTQSNRSYNLLMYLTILIGVLSFIGFFIQLGSAREQKNRFKETFDNIKNQAEQTIKQSLTTLEIAKNTSITAKELIENARKDVEKIETQLNELQQLQNKFIIEQERLKEFDDDVQKRLETMKPSEDIEEEVKKILINDIKSSYKYPKDLKKEWLNDIKEAIKKLKNENNNE